MMLCFSEIKLILHIHNIYLINNLLVRSSLRLLSGRSSLCIVAHRFNRISHSVSSNRQKFRLFLPYTNSRSRERGVRGLAFYLLSPIFFQAKYVRRMDFLQTHCQMGWCSDAQRSCKANEHHFHTFSSQQITLKSQVREVAYFIWDILIITEKLINHYNGAERIRTGHFRFCTLNLHQKQCSCDCCLAIGSIERKTNFTGFFLPVWSSSALL